MKFVDYVTVTVRSGNGGPGSKAFRREKFAPRGGPAGGDGGDGGSVIMTADKDLYTLLDLRYNRHHFAKNGAPGGSSQKKGKSADDIILRVPEGTVAWDTDTEEPIGEVLSDGDAMVLVKGGLGGRGNTWFKSSTNRAPEYAQPGQDGEERNISLELKLLADVGLVGFPNAGKSTLLSSVSAAKPKIADYPFTTLAPALGVVAAGEYRSFVMADIPGIIEGAHEGKGLGIQFLKHIERNPVLLFVIPVTSPDPSEEYRMLMLELTHFSADLATKPCIVALSKCDLIPADALDDHRREIGGQETVLISSVTGMGLDELRRAIWQRLQTIRA